MEFHFGADARGRDDEKLGYVRGVVLEPDTDQIASLIVEHAGFDERRVLVPIGAVESASHDGTDLALSRQQFDQMPNFAIDRNIAPPPTADNLEDEDNIAPENVPDVPPVGAATGVESIAFTPIIQETENIPGDDDVIDAQTVVRATDGEIGSVADVLVDDQTNRITALALEKGFIFKHEVKLPIGWAVSIQPEEIVLNVDRARVEAESRT